MKHLCQVVRTFVEAFVILLAFSALYIIGSLLIKGHVDWY